MTGRIHILGHRGVIAEAGPYMNSAAAFALALAMADGFETDACVTQDGEVFLIHEAKYADAATGVEYCMSEHLDAPSAAALGGRRMDQMTAAEVRQLRLRDGAPIPALQETLDLLSQYPGKVLNIELKAFDVAGPVLRILRAAFQSGLVTPDMILISSFNHPALLQVREQMPALKLGALFIADDMPPAPLFPWQPGSNGAYTPLTTAVLADPVLIAIQPDFCVMPEYILTADTIRLVEPHFPDARLIGWVFTEKGVADMTELAGRMTALEPKGKIVALIVDHPREYAAFFRWAAI